MAVRIGRWDRIGKKQGEFADEAVDFLSARTAVSGDDSVVLLLSVLGGGREAEGAGLERPYYGAVHDFHGHVHALCLQSAVRAGAEPRVQNVPGGGDRLSAGADCQ
ncbi:hypothetical protein D1872_247500 [compost metagenome]